jgi:hypothetical protein
MNPLLYTPGCLAMPSVESRCYLKLKHRLKQKHDPSTFGTNLRRLLNSLRSESFSERLKDQA